MSVELLNRMNLLGGFALPHFFSFPIFFFFLDTWHIKTMVKSPAANVDQEVTLRMPIFMSQDRLGSAPITTIFNLIGFLILPHLNVQ